MSWPSRGRVLVNSLEVPEKELFNELSVSEAFREAQKDVPKISLSWDRDASACLDSGDATGSA